MLRQLMCFLGLHHWWFFDEREFISHNGERALVLKTKACCARPACPEFMVWMTVNMDMIQIPKEESVER